MQKKNMLIRMEWVEEYNNNYMWIEYTRLNNLIHKTIFECGITVISFQ
jgi:hypothetical protein